MKATTKLTPEDGSTNRLTVKQKGIRLLRIPFSVLFRCFLRCIFLYCARLYSPVNRACVKVCLRQKIVFPCVAPRSTPARTSACLSCFIPCPPSLRCSAPPLARRPCLFAVLHPPPVFARAPARSPSLRCPAPAARLCVCQSADVFFRNKAKTPGNTASQKFIIALNRSACPLFSPV